MSLPTADEIARRYGLEALPESVRRLTQLVTRQDADLEELAKIISQDKALVARVLRAANPRAESERDYAVTSVEAALQRTGIGAALLLAMADPLSRAMQKTFVTMLGIQLKVLPITVASPWTGEHVLGEVHFDGKATGTACLHLEPPSAQALAALMLGQSPTDLLDPGEVNDVIGELTNMVVGNFKSNLCDAGLACKLSLPRIRRTAEFSLRAVRGGLSERLAFRAPPIEIFVDLCVNPWSC